MGKVSIAQIGVGYWGPNLLRNLLANDQCEVTKVAELSTSRQDFIKSLSSKIAITSLADEVIEDPSIRAVVIATPFHTHFSLAKKCLLAGKHVLVEKPMAASSGEVEEIGHLATKKNLIAMAGHTFVYSPAVRTLRTLMQDGLLGETRYIYSQRLNLGRIRSDVDALWNFAPHDISILQYLLDDEMPIEVGKHGIDFVQPGIDDVVFLNLLYPKKIMANIHVSWLDPNRTRRMVIVGSKKMAVYDDTLERKIAVYDKGIDRMAALDKNMDYDTKEQVDFVYRSGNVDEISYSSEEPLSVQISHFIDCIKNGTPCMTGSSHASRVIKILEMSSGLK